MQLLNRDPVQRPSMPEFYRACTSIFSTSSTYTGTTGAGALSGTNTVPGQSVSHESRPAGLAAVPDTDDDDYTMTMGRLPGPLQG